MEKNEKYLVTLSYADNSAEVEAFICDTQTEVITKIKNFREKAIKNIQL